MVSLIGSNNFRIIPRNRVICLARVWNNSKIITTNQRYHQRRCLEAWHINSAHAPLNRDDGGLLPDAYLHLINRCHYPKSSIKGNSLRRSDHP